VPGVLCGPAAVDSIRGEPERAQEVQGGELPISTMFCYSFTYTPLDTLSSKKFKKIT